MRNHFSDKRLLLLLPIILMGSLLLASQAVPRAHAMTGLVCITTSTTATSCPTSAPTIGPLTVGSTFSVGVFIQNSDPMGGFDIYVAVNPAFLHPVSAALGSLIVTPTLTSICVNNVATTGTCTANSANANGVVEVTTVESSGSNECGGIGPCSGMAFTINYQVVGAVASTPIFYPTAPSCGVNTSVSGTNDCVLVSDAFGNTLLENIQGATVTQNVVTVDPTSTALSCGSPVTVGTATTCTATVTDTAASGATNPTGTVTYSSSGSGSFSPATTCNLSNSGTNAGTCSVQYTPSAVGTGTHNINATYGGDATHTASKVTTLFALTVAKATPTVTTAVSPATINVGSSATDLATVSGGFSPTGTVTYTAYSDSACTTLVFTSSGIALGSPSAAFTPATAGTYFFKASYSGDANNNVVTTACGATGETLTVNKVTPTVTTTVTPASITIGSSASDLATVSGGSSPTGTITYTAYSDAACTTLVFTSAGVAIGSPSTAFTPTAAGTYFFKAAYSGDANNNAVTTACGAANETLTVTKATPNVATNVSPATITVGSSATDTATVTGGFSPTGTVTYTAYSDSACATLVFTSSGIALGSPSGAFTPGSAGTYFFKAAYSGDANNNAVTTACGATGETLTVNKVTPTVTTSVSPPSINVGSSATDLATVTGFSPTGTVTYTAYSDTACSTLVFTSSNVPLGTPSGAFTPTAAGTYFFKAAYSGDTNNNAVTTVCGAAGETLTVNKVTPTVTTTVSPSSIPLGGSATDLATVSGGFSPTGTVTYTAYSDTACATLVFTSANVPLGSSSAPFTPAAAGTYFFKAAYSGDANNNAVTTACGASGETLGVGKTVPTVTTAVSPASITIGGSATDLATVTGSSPTGTVTYTAYSDAACSTLVFTSSNVPLGTASAAFTPAAPGTYRFVAAYSGDGNNTPVTTACGASGETLTVNKATPTVTTAVSPASITIGSSATDLASFTGGFSPTGTVTYTAYSDTACATLVFTSANVPKGTASGAFTPSVTGTYFFKAAYSGDANNNAVTTACGATGETLTVTKASPTVTTALTPSSITIGGSATDLATVSGGFSASGTVTYTAYSDSACTTLVFTSASVPLGSPSAMFTPAAVGSYFFKAAYSGDVNNNPFTTACGAAGETLTVTKATPTVTTAVSPNSIKLGGSATDLATLTNGFSPTGTVTYTAYSDTACATLVFTSANVALGTPSAAFTPAAVGTYFFKAAYSGDANNNAVTTACGAAGETLTVAAKATPTVTTQVTPSTVTLGSSATDLATVSGGSSPTGTVTYTAYSNAACTTLVFTSANRALGTASAAFTPSAIGSYFFVANYSGDANNNSVKTACGATGETLTVVSGPLVCITSPSTSTSCPTSAPSIPETLGATFTVGVFVQNSQPMAGFDIYISVNPAYLNPTSVTLGTLIANQTSTTVCINDVSIQGTCGATPPTGAEGQGIVEVSTVESSGLNECGNVYPCSGLAFTITYQVVGTSLSTPINYEVDGVTCSTSSVSSPSNVCVLISDNQGNTISVGIQGATVTQTATVHATSTSFTCSPTTETVGLSTTCTVIVTDTSATSPNFPTGTISFTSNGSGAFSSSCTLSQISASKSECFTVYTPTAVGTGSHTLTATYPGDGVHTGSSGNFVLTVIKAVPQVSSSVIGDKTASPAPPSGFVAGTSVHDTAQLFGGFPVTGVTGTLTYKFYNNGACTGVGTLISTVTVTSGNNVPNSASTVLSTTGSFGFVANYTGDANNTPASSGCEQITVVNFGLVCITAVSTSTTCGTSSQQVGPLSVGSTFTVGVFIQNSEPLGGFDIYVGANSAYLNPIGVSLGPLIASPTNTVICINDVAVNGTCTVGAANGQGVVEVSTFDSSGANECGNTAPCQGIAFTITYKVVGTNPSIPITFPTDGAGCSPSSVSSPANVCVIVDNALGNTLAEAIQGATVTETTFVHTTSTSITCTGPTVVGQASTCTVIVTDTNSTSANFPTGQVSFSTGGTGAFDPNPCTLQQMSASASECFVTYTPGAVGTGSHTLSATYPGDVVHRNSAGSFILTVSKASPSISTGIIADHTAAAAINVPPGTSVHDTALLLGGYPVTGVTGSVTYTFYANGACTGTGTTVSTVTVGANNNVPNSGSVTLTANGQYSFHAVYGGDANNNAATASCEVVTVQPGIVCIVSPATTTDCGSGPATIGPVTVGQKFTVGVFIQNSQPMAGFDIFVAVNPAFLIPTNATLGTLIASPTLTSICINGVASTGSCTVGSANGPGVVEVSTVEGSGSNECGNQAPCSGLAFTITYQVVGTAPSIPISYPTSNGCTNSSVSSPSNVCVLVTDDVGTTIPETTQGATVTENTTVDNTSTTISCSPNPDTVGQGSNCTVIVTDTNSTAPNFPTGTVSFSTSGSGSFSPNPCTLSKISNSQAECFVTYTPSAVGTGSHTLTATYPGDIVHNGSTGSFILSVTKAAVTLSTAVFVDSSATQVGSGGVTVGNSVRDSAALFGGYPATGVSGTVVYTLYSNGACTGTGTVISTVTVGPANNVPGSATTVPHPAGTYAFQATYSGDANNSPATSPCESFAVNKTNAVVNTVVSPSTITIGGSASDLATLSGAYTPTGTVTYTAYSDSACLNQVFTSTVALGSPSAAFTPSLAGTYLFKASYSGDLNNNPATSACGAPNETLKVTTAGVTITTVVTPASITIGGSASDLATLHGGSSPTGSITYTAYSDSACATQVFMDTEPVGTASAAFHPSAPGTYLFKASYSGDVNNNATSTACGAANETLTVNKASPTVTTAVSPATITIGSSASDLASLSQGYLPTGTVTYTAYSDTACTTAVFTSTVPVGSASGSFTPAAVGTYRFVASYSGDANNNAATTTCGATGETLTVNKATPGLTTTVSQTSVPLGSSVSDQAHLTGGYPSTGVTGTVSYFLFSNGGCTGTGTAAGTATVGSGDTVGPSNSQTPTAAGSYAFNAVYSGDSFNNGVTSACEPFTVNDFSLTAASNSLTINAGTSATDLLTAKSLGGFTGSISLTNSSVPAGVSLSFVPNPITISTAGGSANSTLTVTVAAGTGAQSFTLTVTGTSGSISHQVSISVTITAGVAPIMTKLNWSHDLTLPPVQSMKAFITNQNTNAVNVVIRIVGKSTTNPTLTFDVVCGTTCVNTVGGSVNTTPGLTPVTIKAGGSAKPRFSFALSPAFAGQTVKFTATLYWNTGGTSYAQSNAISGTFFVE